MDGLESRGSIVIGGDASQKPLSAQEEQRIMDILNAAMSALGKVQQYPTLNEIVFDAIDEAGRQILTWLRTHKTLTFESFHGSLQVNKSVLSMASTKKDFAQAFLFYLTERNVRTLEMRQGADKDEIQRFFEYFGKPAKEIVAKKNLPRSLKRMGIRHITLSSELVLDNVIIKTRISDELSRQLARLNVDELLEKANIISQIDVGALHKVGEVASVVTNLSYAKQNDASQRIIDRLSQTLFSDEKQSRLSSAKTFSQIAEKAVDYTLFNLHDNVGSVMTSRLSKEADPEVYSALATGLEKAAEVHIAKGDYAAAMRIIQGFDNAVDSAAVDPSIKKRADFAITKIASPHSIERLIKSLEDAPPGVDDVTVSALSGMGDKSVPALVDFVYTTDNNKALQRALAALKSIGAGTLPELYAEIGENMDDKYRVAFIDIIGEVGNVKSVVKLAPMLAHFNPDVKAAAYRALSRIGGPAAENKMIEELGKGGFDAAFIEARLRDFGQFRNRLPAAVMIELLQGRGALSKFAGNEDIESAACVALGQIGGADAAAALSEVLSPKGGLLGMFGKVKAKEKVQAAACAALGRLGDPAARAVLEKATKSKSPAVQGAAKLALGALSRGETSIRKSAPEAETIVEDAPGAVEPAPSVPPAPAPESASEESVYEWDLGDADPILEHPAEAAASRISGGTIPVEEPAPDLDFSAFETTTRPEVEDAPPRSSTFDDETDAFTALTDFDTNPAFDGSKIRLVVSVGPHVVSNIRIRVPAAGDREQRTDAGGVAVFELSPGTYEVQLQDEAFSVTKTIRVEGTEMEIPIDLQDIFNF